MTRTESRSRPEERGGGRTNGRHFNCSFAYQCSTATTARGHLSLSLSLSLSSGRFCPRRKRYTRRIIHIAPVTRLSLGEREREREREKREKETTSRLICIRMTLGRRVHQRRFVAAFWKGRKGTNKKTKKENEDRPVPYLTASHWSAVVDLVIHR